MHHAGTYLHGQVHRRLVPRSERRRTEARLTQAQQGMAREASKHRRLAKAQDGVRADANVLHRRADLLGAGGAYKHAPRAGEGSVQLSETLAPHTYVRIYPICSQTFPWPECMECGGTRCAKKMCAASCGKETCTVRPRRDTY
jgi:hypothetical protein